MTYRGTTPPFRGPDGRVLPDSIAEITYLRLGGLDQWVMIRGRNLTNPILILLHGGPEASIIDLPNILRGCLWSPKLMWDEISAVDLTKTVPVLQMPIFFFIGRHDHVVAGETSAAYFESLSARSKRFVWFEESAHEPAVEEADTFNRAMAEWVLPVVQPLS
ncbi:MAG: alpha/beta hydrolase [Nitrospira sp.]|jgi:pimeloyl-ACP methyl ester carboxylesterase|nr:alpha/beta hydrolase [Nitrospira sp.]